MNGTYNVTLHTPIGVKNGTITFFNKNEMLNGSIRTMGNTSFFMNGKTHGNSFEFSGILNAGFFRISYTAKGTVIGDVLKAVASTKIGTFQINGTRTA